MLAGVTASSVTTPAATSELNANLAIPFTEVVASLITTLLNLVCNCAGVIATFVAVPAVNSVNLPILRFLHLLQFLCQLINQTQDYFEKHLVEKLPLHQYLIIQSVLVRVLLLLY